MHRYQVCFIDGVSTDIKADSFIVLATGIWTTFVLNGENYAWLNTSQVRSIQIIDDGEG